MNRLRLSVFLAALLLVIPSPASAWWEYGHETTAEVAMKLVQPRTRQSIQALLRQQKVLETPTCPVRTIEEASVWPDCIKTLGDRFSYAYTWHFQDADICKPFDLKEWCADGNCVSKQIARTQRMVADRQLPVRDRLMALAFLIHFVGDLHQPLHSAEHDHDQGGNKLKLRYGFIPRTNLHAVWDGLLADRAISSPPPGPDGILSQIAPAERATLAQGSIEDWSRDSWQVAKTSVYGTVLPDPCNAPVPQDAQLDQTKIDELIPVLRLQIAKGGIRLARLLDEALDGNHPEVAHPPKPAKAAS
ncbi:S1/P1 nuclease [Sphingomonas sp.]|uniref:S1/P1 nuclease n=1 Tax=Sphingomonas sp. TaxID=28214 RepID=UPI003B3B6C0E